MPKPSGKSTETSDEQLKNIPPALGSLLKFAGSDIEERDVHSLNMSLVSWANPLPSPDPKPAGRLIDDKLLHFANITRVD